MEDMRSIGRETHPIPGRARRRCGRDPDIFGCENWSFGGAVSMRRFAIILLKSLAVLLLVCFAASVAFAGWVSWYYSARLDLPTVEKLRAVSPADRICSSGGERTYVALTAVPAVVAMLSSLQRSLNSMSSGRAIRSWRLRTHSSSIIGRAAPA
jgi:hypothetical protein